MFTVGNIFVALLTSVILYFLFNCYLRPYLYIQYYKKQGGIGLFHWQLLSVFKNYKNARERGDFYYLYKEAFRKNPQAKFLVENFGSKPLLALMDPEMIKQVLQRHEIYQRDKDAVQLFMDLTRGTIIFAEKEDWKKQRRIISSAFSFDFIKNMVPVMIDVAQEQFDDWIKTNSLKKLPMFEKAAGVSGEVTGRIFFGYRFSQKRYEGQSLTTLAIHLAYTIFNEAFDIFSIIFGSSFPKLGILPRHRKLNKTIAGLRNLCSEMVKEIGENSTGEDYLLNRLLNMRKNGEENTLTDDQIVGEFVGLFGAGTDTTANLVTSAIYFLCRNPEAYKKVREEVEREIKDPQSVTIENINNMNYFTAFLKETLRLEIGCLFYRVAVQDDDLCGVKIKKGTAVNIFLNVNQTSEKFYSQPDEFIPERWLPNNSFSNDPFKSEPFSFLPFGAGPRNCLGQHLAMIEAKLLLGLMIKKFSFSIPDDYKLNLVQGLVFEPLEPLLLDLELRK